MYPYILLRQQLPRTYRGRTEFTFYRAACNADAV